MPRAWGYAIDEAVVKWFEDERGITASTLAEFGVRQDGDYLVFPYEHGEKMRKNPLLDGPREFKFSAGAKLTLFRDPAAVGTKQMFLVEGETDTMRLHQEVGTSATVLGLSGVNAWRPEYAKEFDSAERVFVILDNDEDYNVAAVVDKTWRSIRNDIGPKARRVALPAGTKDVCDFFKYYDVDTLRELCKRSSGATRRFKDLDLTQDVRPVDWLVDEWFARGDVTLLVGDPGLGKSWLTMALACAVAEGNDWLGLETKQGSVMYVDEENPEDIVKQRFKKLGLSPGAAKRIHYLYRPGIWVNKDPDAFLDEALSLEPALIVMDSLSRIHSEDENSANSMAKLFRDGIQPLARETGAAVVVIHHTIKGDATNSFKRARGSGDISAVVDAAIDVSGWNTPGRFSMTQYKSRRRLGGDTLTISIEDTDNGLVKLVPDEYRF